MVGLMRFPCLGMSRDKQGKLIPRSMGKKRKYKGHMSHVMSLRWSNDDTYLFSVGGLDCSTFQWKHVVKNEDTKELEAMDPFEDEPESVWNPNNFGRTMEDILLEINNNRDTRGKISRKTQGPAR